MNNELKRDVTELLRGDNRNWDKMDKVLSQITEEQFVQMGLEGVFNQIAKQFTMAQGAVANAKKYPWVGKYINLDNYGGTLYRQLQPLTIPELLVNIRIHKYKDITNILGDILYKLYINGKVELTPHVEDLITILDSISVKERKGVYDSLIWWYYRNSGVMDKKLTYIRGTENYKHILKLIGEALDRNASGPLSGGDIILDFYHQERPHFIGWTITINDIMYDILNHGFKEGVIKHKLTRSQCYAIAKYFGELNNGDLQFLLDSELESKWADFIKQNGGFTGLYTRIRDIDKELKDKKAQTAYEGKKERTDGIGMNMATPQYRVVRVNYKSKAKIVSYIKLNDVVQFAYYYNGMFTVIVNGDTLDFTITETDLYNSFNIRTNTKCIYDLEVMM